MSQVVEEFYPDAAREDSRNGASAVSKLKDNLISTKLVSG
jgi:hypothetical protein